MSDYAFVKSTLWTGETGLQLRAAGPDAQLIAAYLITCPSRRSIGIYSMPLALMSQHLNTPIPKIRKSLEKVAATGFCEYSEAFSEVWIPEMAAHQFGEKLELSDKKVKGIHRALNQIKHSPFFGRFIERYREAYHLQAYEAHVTTPSATPSDASIQYSVISNQGSDNSNQGSEREALRQSAFLEWFAAYPRRTAKGEAERAYRKAIQAIEAEGRDAVWLLEVTRRFAKSSVGVSGQYCPYPATWLNQARYNDDPAEWNRRGGKSDGDPRGNMGVVQKYLEGGDDDAGF